MSEYLGERIARSAPATECAAEDDPWLDDQTTTKYTRMETESAAHETPKATPSWSRVITVCVGAASCLVFGQVLWSVRALPPAAVMTQLDSTEASTGGGDSANGKVASLAIEETMAPSAALDQPAVTDVQAQNVGPVVSTKRRDQAKRGNHTRTRKSAASGAQSDGLPATMRIDSRPWSDVTVDGHLIGRTPQSGVSLTPGKHKVLLHNPEADVLKILVLHVLPGETIERVEVLSEGHPHDGQP